MTSSERPLDSERRPSQGSRREPGSPSTATQPLGGFPISVIGRLTGLLPRRSLRYLDQPRVTLRAAFGQVDCRIESSGPDTTEGAGPGAIPPVWFEGGSLTAFVGVVDLGLHAFSDEPAELTARIGLGEATIAVPDEWVVHLDVRTLGGRFADDRRGSSPTRDDGVVHLVVTGWVVLGRLRVVGDAPESP